MNRVFLVIVSAVSLALPACRAFDDALTGHARPVASVAGLTLDQGELAQLMADSPMPDSALTPYWAGQLARLWADYVVLSQLYADPDTTRSVDYGRLLEDGRHLSAIAVTRYRDSVVMAGVEPTEQELRDYFETRHPFTRLDVRRVVLTIPGEDGPAVDSVIAEATAIRERLVGGADFVEVAREKSSEPMQARGQILAFQGTEDFPPGAGSVLFTLRPGEISPVVRGDGEVLIYRIEARREPDFEAARDQLYRRVLEEREQEKQQRALVEELGSARRTVLQGALGVTSEVARDPSLAVGRIPDGMRLATWSGGHLTVGDLRRLFVVREDLRQAFAEATEDEIYDYLMQLARDEILIHAAVESGVTATPEERQALSNALADQLAHIAGRMGLTSELVGNPRFDLGEQAYYFLQGVMARSKAVPWLGEFRVVLDPLFPVRIDDGGARSTARHARELRAAGTEPTEPQREVPEMEAEPSRAEVG